MTGADEFYRVRLARAEQERDQARADLASALAAASDHRDFHRQSIEAAHADVERIARTADLLRAELASARAELDQLRAAHAHCPKGDTNG